MPNTCEHCSKDNRTIARFCKHCGEALAAQKKEQDNPLESLVGLENIAKEVRSLEKVIAGMKQDGRLVRMNYNTILVGNPGTAKSLLGNILFHIFAKHEIIKQKQIQYFDAVDFKPEVVGKSKGGLLFIDNVQQMISNGAANENFNKLLSEMSKHGNDPIVVLAGLPYGLREFLDNEQNRHITGRFKNIFQIDDYGPQILSDIIKLELKKENFTLNPEAETRLLQRCKHLHKKMNDPSAMLDKNGHLAKKESQEIIENYYIETGSEHQISPDHIKGDVEIKKSIEEIMGKLDAFVGLQEIKNSIKGLYQELKIQREKAAMGVGTAEKIALHFVITGNPGTGKTTIVRVLGEILEAIGVLENGSVVEVDQSKMIAPYTGQTAPQVNRLCDSAMGGILFVDEAYTLAKDGQGSGFGQEAIDTLLKRMEDDRGKFITIAAGYKTEMENFLTANPGLKSRFTHYFHFEDYAAEELSEIFKIIAKSKKYKIDAGAEQKLLAVFKDMTASKTKNFGNGREARNLFEKVKNMQSKRVAAAMSDQNFDREELTLIRAEDIPSLRDSAVSVDDALKKLNKFTGLRAVKQKVHEIIDSLEAQKIRGQQKLLTNHFVFAGNPGTGKTTIARVLGDIFQAIGLLPTNNLIEADRGAMVAGFKGQTAKNVNKICDRAMGGILFVDEAYTLKQGDSDDFGQEAIDTLLKRMEDDRGKFIVIAAGYSKEMEDFLDSNPGLRSRFTDTLMFEDFSADELVQIFKRNCAEDQYELASDVEEPLQKLFNSVVMMKDKNFGNAREARKVLGKTTENLSARVLQMKRDGVSPEALRTAANLITLDDLPVEKDGEGKSIEEVLAELNKLTGLQAVKNKVNELISSIEVQKLRGKEALISAHFVFTGNPGTGKTTVARLLGDIFKGIGLLPSNKIIETDRGALVAGYTGQTAIQVNKICDRAMGGILFVDEAYTLKQGDNDSFGQEAIDTLLKRMEDDRGKFVVIAAGYSKEMSEFLDSNSGLRSRFTDMLEFEDFSAPELVATYQRFAGSEGFELDSAVLPELDKMFDNIVAMKSKNFGNAREARKLFDQTRENLSMRLIEMKKSGSDEDTLMAAANTILVDDLPIEKADEKPSIESILQKLNNLTGLTAVKSKVQEIIDTLEMQKIRGKRETLTNHFVFTGNPGTGKTTVARLLGDIFASIGLLPSNRLIEADRGAMVAGYKGQTAIEVNKLCDRAIGGILFVDEAYTLKQAEHDDFGQEAIDTMLKRMEDDRGKFIVIAAGYTREMKTFLDSNSGLRSRFTATLEFEDFSAPELVEVFKNFAIKEDFAFDAAVEEKLIELFENIVRNKDQNFGNARTARKLFDETRENIAARVKKLKIKGADMATLQQAASELKVEDLPK